MRRALGESGTPERRELVGLEGDGPFGFRLLTWAEGNHAQNDLVHEINVSFNPTACRSRTSPGVLKRRLAEESHLRLLLVGDVKIENGGGDGLGGGVMESGEVWVGERGLFAHPTNVNGASPGKAR